MAKSLQKNRIANRNWTFVRANHFIYRDDIAIPNIGEKNYKRYMSYLLTIFFFVWIVNLFGLTPLGVNSN